MSKKPMRKGDRILSRYASASVDDLRRNCVTVRVGATLSDTITRAINRAAWAGYNEAFGQWGDDQPSSTFTKKYGPQPAPKKARRS